jgi:hypothetical protein
MIWLISVVQNDYLLALIDVVIIFLSSIIYRFRKSDFAFLLFGFVIMSISEYTFVSLKVETFRKTSLFDTMPFWLPFLWSYGFVAIKRAGKTFSN